MLLFCSYHFRSTVGQPELRTAITAVDRRNGCVVYNDSNSQPMQTMETTAEGDPAAKTVKVIANGQQFELRFTDKPVMADIREASGDRKPPSNVGNALLDASRATL